MSPLRIGLGAALLALAGGAALWLSGERATVEPAPGPGPSPPVMDVGDASVRRVLLSLSADGPQQFNGRSLASRCNAQAGERYELARVDFGNFTRQRALFLLDGDSGRFHFDARAITDASDLQLGRSWTLDKAQVQRVRALLHASGYPGLPIAGPQDEAFCHQPSLSVESCIGDRYFGIARRCEGVFEQDDRPVHEMFDGIDALMAEVSEGETGRQLGRVASARVPAY